MRYRFAAVVLAALTAVLPASAPAAPATPAVTQDSSCVRTDLNVRLFPGEPGTHHVAGWLCGATTPIPEEGRTVILASPSGFSSHVYWDWPKEKHTYSFVRAMVSSGYAVFNYDRIGTGESDRPNAALINLHSEAYLQHQIVEGLRSGAIGGVRFQRVVLAGNSLSTLINTFQAELFHDVDGLINTGIVVGPSPVGLATLFSALYPAQLDPKFANDASIPPGYATTQPGARSKFFHLPTADPAVVALDEELKETGTLGEAATFAAWYPFTRTVDVPVLSVIGDHDVLACLSVCEPGGPEETKERLFWSDATCFQMVLVKDAGHFLQLQSNSAAAFAAEVREWLARRIGNGPTHAPTAPCLAP